MKRLVDVDKMMAEVTSTATQASYHNGSVGTKPTRIDGILVNQSFAAAIKNVSTVQDTGIPGHRPPVVRTDMAHPLQWVNKSKVLPKIKLQHDVDDLEKVLLPHLQTYTEEWDQMVQSECIATAGFLPLVRFQSVSIHVLCLLSPTMQAHANRPCIPW